MTTKQKNIFLVEDEQAHAELISRAFESRGGQFQLTIFSTIHEARDFLKKSVPDLLISDLILPDGKGTELIPLDTEASPYPVLIMTSHGSEKIAVETMKAGALDYVVKTEAVFAEMPRIAERTLREWAHITLQHEAEKALKKSNERYHELATNLPGLVYQFVLHPDGSYSMPYITTGVKGMFGVSAEEINKDITALLQFLHPHDVLEFENSIKKSAESLSQYNIEFRVLVNGEVMWIIAISRPKLLANGDILWDGILFDITDRKRAEEELKESEKTTRLLLEHTVEAIYGRDTNGVCTFANPSCLKMLGYQNAGDIIGKNIHNLIHSKHPDGSPYPETKCRMYKAFKSKTIHIDDEVFWRADGSSFPVEYWSHPVYSEDNEVCGWVTTFFDISSRKKAEEEKLTLESQLRQAQKMEAIGTLAGGIAHDFNNILAAILGYADMAKEDSPKGSSVAEDLDKVLQAGHRAKDLVKQILAFSRQAEAEPMLLQPASLVKESIKMLRPSLPTTIEINQDIDPAAGPIFADPTQIHQILINLCTNSFHAMEETGGRLDISLKETTFSREDLVHEPSVEAGTFVQLSVSDSGPGIAPEIKGRIFDPFFTTKSIGKGTGMGLSIVHGIMKSYGGFISLYSEPGEGTKFHIFFPVINKEALPEFDATIEQIPIGRERVLFIDDEDLLAELNKDMLERLGYDVTIRNSSLAALETFQNQPDQFDVVITDQTMPGMTGSDLARRMLQIRPDIPIILCTGYSTIISEEKAKSVGIKEFAMKPIAKRDIAALIRKVLDAA